MPGSITHAVTHSYSCYHPSSTCSTSSVICLIADNFGSTVITIATAHINYIN